MRLLVFLAALWTGQANGQTFVDVSSDYWAYNFIEIMAFNGITAGCGGENYCPEDSVTRAQMAVFLERGINGSDFVPAAASGTVFNDVAAGDFAAAWIEQLYTDGITAGCGNNNYCPDAEVSRAQMAVFLLRAKYGAGYSPPPATGMFNDVDLSYWAVHWIEALAAEGITAGCGNSNFCPEALVTRAQMAVFLVRTFELTNTFRLNLSGTATDLPLPYASIVATVYEAGSGGGSSQAFSTTADSGGHYAISIESTDASDFVVLEATGSGQYEEAKLVSLLGSVGSLHRLGSGNPVSLGISDYGSLEISHISTATAVLSERANGGSVLTDAELVAAQSRVTGAEMLTMASVIKAIVDRDEVSLPLGFSNTLDLVENVAAYDSALADLESNHPQFLESAMLGTADHLSQGFSESEVPGNYYLAYRDARPLGFGAYALVLNGDNSGQIVLANGSSSVTWHLNATGNIVIDLLDPPITESYPTNPLPNPVNPQVRALTYLDSIELARLLDGPASDQLVTLETSVTDYPDEPLLDQEINGDFIGPDDVVLATKSENVRKFTIDEISGTTIATTYFQQNNNSLLYDDPEFGADFLQFNANNTGIASRRLLTFVWSITSEGILVVRFANGDETRFARYSNDNIVSQVVAVSDLSSGESKVLGTELIERQAGIQFSESLLLDRRFRAVWSYTDPENDLDFLFLANGVGCRITTYLGTEYPRDLDWSITAGNLMDSFLWYPGYTEWPLQRRSWELIAIEPGIFGDRYWVLRVLDFDNTQDGTHVFADPAITSGQINAYEYISDLAGQAAPCGL